MQVIEPPNESQIDEATEINNLLSVLSIEKLQSIRNCLIIQDWLAQINQSINQSINQ